MAEYTELVFSRCSAKVSVFRVQTLVDYGIMSVCAAVGNRHGLPLELQMPRISSFLGITIYMYWRDHNPPHFHAAYGEHVVLVDIADLKVLEGELYRKLLSFAVFWKTSPKKQGAIHRKKRKTQRRLVYLDVPWDTF